LNIESKCEYKALSRLTADIVFPPSIASYLADLASYLSERRNQVCRFGTKMESSLAETAELSKDSGTTIFIRSIQS